MILMMTMMVMSMKTELGEDEGNKDSSVKIMKTVVDKRKGRQSLAGVEYSEGSW